MIVIRNAQGEDEVHEDAASIAREENRVLVVYDRDGHQVAEYNSDGWQAWWIQDEVQGDDLP